MSKNKPAKRHTIRISGQAYKRLVWAAKKSKMSLAKMASSAILLISL